MFNRLSKRFAVGMALVLLTWVAGGSKQVGFAQADCAVTVQPGQSIQQAINAAAEGAVICLSAGTFQENIEIRKSLTLRGVGQAQTILKARNSFQSVIALASGTEIQVVLQALTISNGSSGLDLSGSAQATLTDSTVSGNRDDGLVLGGSAQATLEGNTIKDNARWGVVLYQAPCVETDEKFTGKVEGQDNVISGNGKALTGLEKQAGDGVGDLCPKELEFLKKK